MTVAFQELHLHHMSPTHPSFSASNYPLHLIHDTTRHLLDPSLATAQRTFIPIFNLTYSPFTHLHPVPRRWSSSPLIPGCIILISSSTQNGLEGYVPHTLYLAPPSLYFSSCIIRGRHDSRHIPPLRLSLIIFIIVFGYFTWFQ